MSNILDALRKAQSEQKFVKDAPSSKTEKLISPRGGSGQKNSNKRVIVIGCCGAVLLLVVGWILYGPSKESKKPLQQAEQVVPPPPTASMPQPQITSAQVQAPMSSAQAKLQQPEPSNAAPVPPNQIASTPAPTMAAPPSGASATSTAATERDEEDSPSRRRHKNYKVSSVRAESPAQQLPVQASSTAPSRPEAPSSASQTAVPASFGAPEGVKLSGIAWQANRKMRRAVVNDILVGEGVSVSGARVVEIKKNSVKFEKNGTFYETSLAK